MANPVQFKLSPEREKEFTDKLEKALDYFERLFGDRLSPTVVYKIMRRHIEANKERLFLQSLGIISEADLLWYAAENGLSSSGEVNGKVGSGQKATKGNTRVVAGGEGKEVGEDAPVS